MAYTIDDLNALVQAASGDELPIWDVSATGNEEPTKKITLQNLAAVIKTLASLLGTGDVVDNLTSTATDKPLSANMGKALSDKVTTKTAITITPGTHISIDQNDTYYCGEIIIIDFKCHTTAAIGATETIATLNTPNSRFLKQSGSIVPLIKGTEWGVSGLAYGYINTRTISSNNLASGDYLHVYFTAFLD